MIRLIDAAVLVAAAAVLLTVVWSRFSGDKPAQAAELAKQPGTFVLDVRTQGEYAQGHLERSVLIPVQQLAGRLSDLPADILGRADKAALVQAGPEATLGQALEATERSLLQEARQRHGNQALMAKALGVDQSTIARKMKKYGLT